MSNKKGRYVVLRERWVEAAKYTPVHQILTSYDTEQRNWRNYIEQIEKMFKYRRILDLSTYDNVRYLKMNRDNYDYKDYKNVKNQLRYRFKVNGFTLSDHEPIRANGIFSWNLLHHYSYNGSNDYVDGNVIRDKKYPVLSERARYSLLSTSILEEISRNSCVCCSLQECEYAVYAKVVDNLDKKKYSCRFIPHQISYDSSGLYIESYGCALIIKGNDQNSETHVHPVEREYSQNSESGYKYIIRIMNNIMFSSVHFPKYGKYDNYPVWVKYAYDDLEFILSKITGNIEEGYIVGDLNMRRCVLDSFLLVFPEYNFKILENVGVDYIIHVSKKFQFHPSSLS